MDDIARDLSISKKTIYQFFKDKDELVMAVTLKTLETYRSSISQAFGKASDAVEEIILVIAQVNIFMSTMHPGLFYDMQKYHPQTWNLFSEFKEKFILEKVKQNLRKGISEGLYRKEINIDIIARMRIEQVDMAFNSRVFPPGTFSAKDVMYQLTDHYLHGIVTLKGHKLVNRYQQVNEEE